MLVAVIVGFGDQTSEDIFLGKNSKDARRIPQELSLFVRTGERENASGFAEVSGSAGSKRCDVSPARRVP